MHIPLNCLAWPLNVACAWQVRGSSATRMDLKDKTREHYAGYGLHDRMARLMALRKTFGRVDETCDDLTCRMIAAS